MIEVFAGAGGPVFDPLVAADVAAGMTLDHLLAPDRLTRLIDQHRRDPAQIGVGEVLDRLIETVFAPAPGRLGEVSRRVQTRLVLDLAQAERDPKLSPAAASQIAERLRSLPARLKGGADAADRAHRQRLVALLADRDALALLAAPKVKPETPPGMPIGDDDYGVLN